MERSFSTTSSSKQVMVKHMLNLCQSIVNFETGAQCDLPEIQGSPVPGISGSDQDKAYQWPYCSSLNRR